MTKLNGYSSMYIFFGLLVLGVLDKKTLISKTISHCSKQCIRLNYSYIAKEKRKVEEQISHEYEQNKTIISYIKLAIINRIL